MIDYILAGLIGAAVGLYIAQAILASMIARLERRIDSIIKKLEDYNE